MIIHKSDNVEINISDGHKYARNPIKKGEAVIKYGNPIGYATEDIQAGEWVHTHNLVTGLSDEVPYTYPPVDPQGPIAPNNLYFMGYERPNGDVGIRNEIWIIVTVGCVNKIAERIAGITGAFAFPHPYGCSQLGDDHAITQKVLCGLVNHPNCGGALVLGLGCVQKAGSAPVTDVLDYGDRVQKPGLSLLNGPGNDMVAVTNLTAAGAHLILFTTGRGTPLGAPVPTVKIATNHALAVRKSKWIDFDASPVLNGVDLDDAFFSYVLEVASGKQTKNEMHGYREISIFKQGVTL